MSIMSDIKCSMCSKDYHSITQLKSHMIRKHQIRLCSIRCLDAEEAQDIKSYGQGATLPDLDKIVKRMPEMKWSTINREYDKRQELRQALNKQRLREIGLFGRVSKSKQSTVIYVYKNQAENLVQGEYVRVRPIGVTVPIKTKKVMT